MKQVNTFPSRLDLIFDFEMRNISPTKTPERPTEKEIMTVIKKLTTLILSASLVPVFGTVLNPNAEMELGEIGKPVPAWQSEILQANREIVMKNRSRKLSALTTKDGRVGKGMVCLPDQGVIQYRLSCPDIYLDKDCEVEISLDTRIGKRSDDKPVSVSIGVDFRCLGDISITTKKKKWDHPRYPELKAFRISPKTVWTTVKKRFKVRGWHNLYTYHIQVNMGENQVPVYLDNVRIRKIDGKKDHPQEGVLIPEHGNCCYFHGEKMNFRLNARLAGSAEKINGKLTIFERESKKVWKEIAVVLTKRPDQPQNGLSLYTADVMIPADRYGVFKSALSIDKKEIPLYGQFSVLHQPVRHPRWSPGWGIGMNMLPGNPGNAYATPHKAMDKIVSLRNYGSWNSRFTMARLAGMNCVRAWCTPKDVHPEADRYRTNIIGPVVEGMKENDIEIIMCLDGFKIFHDRGPNPEGSEYPPFLHKYYVPIPGPKRRFMLDCPEQILRDYFGFVVKTWGKDIRFWEIYNEPGVAVGGAPLYLKHLKFAYGFIKSFDKNYFVLGNGNTGDVGFDSGWFRALNKVNPDYVDDLDGIAFHPYHNSTDFIKNSYGAYSQHIRQIRESLKKDRPLINTECFYITNARNPQIDFYINKSVIEPEAIVRHYVDGMINQIKAASAVDESSIRERDAGATGEACISAAATATNALSAMLTGMTRVERIDMGRYMNAGLFTSSDRKQALGIIYDMRPNGSMVRFKNIAGLRFFDIYGNPLEKIDGEKLEYEALYLKGSEAAVRRFFREAKFVPGEAAPVYAKICGGRAYLAIPNTLSMTGEIEIRFAAESKLPNVRFDFRSKTSDAVNDIPLPPEGIKNGTPYSVHVGGALIGSGKLQVFPVSASYAIGSKTEAKPLKLSDGSTAEVWHENGNLCFKVQVKQDQTKAPSQNKAPWTGDAVELFIDPAPFDNIRANQITGTVPLNCFQYAFSAKPSPDGKNMVAISRANPGFRSNAVAKSTLTADGYILEGTIPLAEIAPGYGNVLGLEIEINRPGKAKESLSGMKKPSYMERGHYQLFRIVREPTVNNFDFSQGEFGDADHWLMPRQSEHNTSRMVSEAGMYGKNAVLMKSTKLLWNGRTELWQRCRIPANANYIRAGVLVKIESVSSTGNPYMWRPQGFFIRFDNDADMSHDRRKCYREPVGWTRFQYVAKLSEAQKKKGIVDVCTGLRNETGVLKIAEFNIDFMEK